ncbi:MAG TPA: CDP-diacylglycerol diphosphatase [Caulobacteraceae bacterium]|jgi:CDP-diacylglycerol pyrophosphatase|nr:CDP-diacylglycerol diphosphatase [Caulobacteraceae bacterium]
MTRRSLALRSLAGVLGLALAVLAATLGPAVFLPAEGTPVLDNNPGALWRVVHDVCVVDRRLLGLPAPCVAVHLREGWAVVKDTREPTHILVVPTRRVAGIESRSLLEPGAPNYWRDAWKARGYFERLLGRPAPRGTFAMVINSLYGRTQDQLHIHIECLQPEVAEALKEAAPDVGAAWAPLDVSLAGQRYEARRIDGEDLDQNPFKLLASGDPEARANMGIYSLAAIPETFAAGEPGFILLARRANLAHGDAANGEHILDFQCSLLRAPSRTVELR